MKRRLQNLNIIILQCYNFHGMTVNKKYLKLLTNRYSKNINYKK